MVNLGSNNTPISGESFGLPSGWSIKENVDGEAIIVDGGDNTIFRRDEVNGEWITDRIDANSVRTDAVNHNGVTPDFHTYFVTSWQEDEDQTTNSTTYEVGLNGEAAANVGEIPDGMTLYGRFIASISISVSTETVSAVPEFTEPGEDAVEILSLEVSSNETASGRFTDSGWVEVTEDLNRVMAGPKLYIKTSDSEETASIRPSRTAIQFAGVSD